MLILGILCFGYYSLICALLKRWNSTFSRFWLLAGTGFLFLHFVIDRYPEMQHILIICSLGIVIAFAIIEIPVIISMIPDKDKNIPYLLVLGAKVMGTKVSDSLRRRLDKAVVYLQENPETLVIVSGGQGESEKISEANAMEEYFCSRGIKKERILKETQSRNTKENIVFSKQLLNSDAVTVGIVTNNFHMYRACIYAKKSGYQSVKKIPAGCHPILFFNYMVREFFAVLKLWILE